jgi:hypothetical protein
MTDPARSSRPPRLSPAAKVALDEYLEAERNRVVREADQLRRSSGPLTARDIVNAYDAIQERERGKVVAQALNVEYRSAGPSLKLAVALVGSGAALVSAVVIAATTLASQGTPPPTPTSDGVVLGLTATIIGIAIAGAGFFLGRYLVSRSSRSNEHVPIVGRDAGSETTESIAATTGSPRGAAFVMRWTNFERDLRKLATNAVGVPTDVAERYPVGELLRTFARSGVISESFYDQTRRALSTRNLVLHGSGASEADLAKANASLDALLAELKELLRVHPESEEGPEFLGLYN